MNAFVQRTAILSKGQELAQYVWRRMKIELPLNEVVAGVGTCFGLCLDSHDSN